MGELVPHTGTGASQGGNLRALVQTGPSVCGQSNMKVRTGLFCNKPTVWLWTSHILLSRASVSLLVTRGGELSEPRVPFQLGPALGPHEWPVAQLTVWPLSLPGTALTTLWLPPSPTNEDICLHSPPAVGNITLCESQHQGGCRGLGRQTGSLLLIPGSQRLRAMGASRTVCPSHIYPSVMLVESRAVHGGAGVAQPPTAVRPLLAPPTPVSTVTQVGPRGVYLL